MTHVVKVKARDPEGNEVTVRAVRPRRPMGTKDEPAATFPGLVATLTIIETGEAVNRLEQGVYEGVHTGTVYRSADPKAP